MTQNKRILIAVVILIVIVGAVLGLDALRRQQVTELEPGSVPIYFEDRFVESFKPDDLERLDAANFVDAEEGKTQEGWLLRDVLLLHIERDVFRNDTTIVVSSNSRGKSVHLTWAEVDDTENMVMFDLSGRGTLKLISKLERLDVRDEWIQDVDKIEVIPK
ncbi:MAG: hypothetical protein GY832_34330 [Chloroflexi bacterium]|nr:hypothetical protein [Chloroflexota bacterium]